MRLFPLRLAAVLLSVLAAWLPGGARAQDQPIDIGFSIAGPDAASLRKSFLQVSQLNTAAAHGTLSPGAAERLADSDAARFVAALHSSGYYAGTVTPKITAAEDKTHVEFDVEPGQRFRITSYAILYTDPGPASRPGRLDILGVEGDGSSKGEDVLAVQQEIVKRLHEIGYPFARVSERRAEANLAAGEAKMVFVTASGPFAHFGKTIWPKGLRTKTDYLQTFITWHEGQIYNTAKTSELRDALAQTGLFTVISVDPGTPASDGTTPVVVSLTEAQPRTFAAGASYSTNLGPGATASWTHRNLMRRGELLEADLDISAAEQSLGLAFKNPKIFPRTDFVSAVTAEHENNDAYNAITGDITAGFERELRKHVKGKVGIELFASQSRDAFGPHQSYLIGFPVGIAFNNINNVLNPTSGTIASATFSPYAGSSGGPVSFSLIDTRIAYHWPFDKKSEYVGAVWAHFGGSIGSNVETIPPDKRFYAGGAGSVRGFGYHLLGPVDDEDNPIGGRSILEGGGEFRFPVRGKFGGVVFLEGGGVSESGFFAFDQGVRYGAGLGFRYYTSIGPIRADFAFPLDPRPGIDDPIQFYIGLGQAF